MAIPVLDDVVAAVSPLVENLSHLTGGPAAAIVLCTVALRLALLPLTLVAVRGERARAALAPRAAELRRAHAADPARFAAELTALHRDAGVSLFAGVLPTLAQAPFFLVWYRIFSTGLVSGALLGAPLSAHLTGAPLAFLPLVAALVALGGVALWRSRRVAAATGNPPPPALVAALPFVSAVTALFLPLAAALYLATTVAWSTGESIVLRRGLPARPPRAG